MPSIVPTIGRIVIYVLSAEDAEKINKRRADAQIHMDRHRAASLGTMIHVGNDVHEGEEFPAMVVKTWGDQPDSYINIKVMLDGTDAFWATSRKVGEGPGFYRWMEYQKGQAAKTERAEEIAKGLA